MIQNQCHVLEFNCLVNIALAGVLLQASRGESNVFKLGSSEWVFAIGEKQQIIGGNIKHIRTSSQEDGQYKMVKTTKQSTGRLCPPLLLVEALVPHLQPAERSLGVAPQLEIQRALVWAQRTTRWPAVLVLGSNLKPCSAFAGIRVEKQVQDSW